MSKAVAEILRDGAAVRLRIGAWSEEFPVSYLDARIAAYAKLAARPEHGHLHAGTLTALQAVKADLEAGDA